MYFPGFPIERWSLSAFFLLFITKLKSVISWSAELKWKKTAFSRLCLTSARCSFIRSASVLSVSPTYTILSHFWHFIPYTTFVVLQLTSFWVFFYSGNFNIYSNCTNTTIVCRTSVQHLIFIFEDFVMFATYQYICKVSVSFNYSYVIFKHNWI